MSLYWALPYVATGCYKFYNLIGSLKLLTNKQSEIMESIACHRTVSARETSKREERFQDQSVGILVVCLLQGLTRGTVRIL